LHISFTIRKEKAGNCSLQLERKKLEDSPGFDSQHYKKKKKKKK
jgi:hypothetical protein